MTVTTTAIQVGAAPGDGTGDPARTAGQTINTNTTNLKAAVELLQSGYWRANATSETLANPSRTFITSGTGITKTLPAGGGGLSTTASNEITIVNVTANAVTVAPQGAETIYLNGSSQGVGTSVTLPADHMAICVEDNSTAGWQVLLIPTQELSLSLDDLSDVTETTPATGELLTYTGAGWENQTTEEAGVVDVDTPAFGANPYVLLTDHGTVTGTATITCVDEPASLVKVGANNVIIALSAPTLSLPARGQAKVKLGGVVHVLIDASTRTGLTVTTTAGTKMSTTFPKGDAPTAANDRASLVWYWIDDGTTDVMWAEWIANNA